MKMISLFFIIIGMIVCQDEVKKKFDSYEILRNDSTTCYEYRADFEVTNTGAEDAELIVLEVDTTLMESYNAFNLNNCGDIRFKTNTESEWDAKHWIETNCPSEHTIIWVEVDVPAGETINLYMYSLCEDTKTSNSEKFDGFFIAMNNGTECGEIWNDINETMLGYFPVSVDGLESGEKSGTPYQTTHHHQELAIQEVFDTSNPNPNPKASCVSDCVKASPMRHSHTFRFPDYEMFPPYSLVKSCISNHFHVKAGFIYFFLNETWGSKNYEVLTEFQDKMLMMSDRTEIKEGTLSHSMSINNINVFADGFQDSLVGSIKVNMAKHSHNFNISYSEEDHTPRRISIITALANNNHIPVPGMIVMGSEVPPFGWEEVSILKNYYIMGGEFSQKTLGSSSHTHAISVKKNYDSGSVSIKSEGENKLSFYDHNHVENYYTEEINNFDIYPHYNVKFFQRKEILNIDFELKGFHRIRDYDKELQWWVFAIIGGGAFLIVLVFLFLIIFVICYFVSRSKVHAKKQEKEFDDIIKEETLNSAEKEVQLLEEKEKIEEEKRRLDEEKEMKKESTENLIEKIKELENETSVIEKQFENIDSIKSTISKVKINKIEFGTKIGDGSVGFKIYKAKYGGKDVLAKMFEEKIFEKTEFNVFQFLETELKEYSTMIHPNILKYIAFTKPPKVCVVTEYCENGHLKGFMQNKKNNLKFSEKVKILKQISCGMEYIHDRGVVHKDLRSENIFITKDLGVRIDFGFNKTFNKNYDTSIYAAPELIDGRDPPSDDEDMEDYEKFDKKCDVFSFSIILFELVTSNYTPYGKVTDIGKKVSEDPDFRPDIDSLKKELPNWIVNLCKNCWNEDGAERPSFKEISQIIESVVEE